MSGLAAWFFVILTVSFLISWAALWLIRHFGIPKIIFKSPMPPDHELSLLDLMHFTLLEFRQGRIQFQRSTSKSVQDQSEVPSNFSEFGETGELEPSDQATLTQPTKIQLSIDLPANATVLLTIHSQPGSGGQPEIIIDTKQEQGDEPVNVTLLSKQNRSRSIEESTTARVDSQTKDFQKVFRPRIFKNISLETVLFGSSILIYLVIRLIGLESFPIYFFTDEAVHTVLAENFVKNGFRFNGTFLPTYFSLGASYGLNSVSVYLQVIPYLLFGKSVFVTRSISVFVTLLGAVAVSLTLKDFFRIRFWWVGILLLSATPVWFFHSRTAFENVELAAFFALFLYFYLCYRLRSPKWLFAAIFSGALVFYTHGLGQFLIAAIGILLLLVDLPYHMQHKKIGLLSLGFILLLALPYLRFSLENSSIFEEQMRMRGTFWLDQNLTLTDKIMQFSREYIRGINPIYWFIPNPAVDLARHQMKGYGYILSFTLPFFLYGVWLAVKNLHLPTHRTILIALMVTPIGAAFAQITILRVIWFVIPAVIITTLGIESLLNWLTARKVAHFPLAIGIFAFFFVINIYILQDALRNGPTWYKDYSLYGMQYGAKQLFGEAIPRYLTRQEDSQVVVTPTWANGTDYFASFFLTAEQQARVKLDSIKAYLFEHLPIDKNLILVLTEPEYQEALASPKFKNIETREIIEYPDGSAGFYFIHLEYSDEADEIFTAEKLARSKPVETTVEIDGQPVVMRYSQIDMGQPEAIFDGDTNTLMRGLEANPFIIEMVFSDPRHISQISADFANMDFSFSAQLFNDLNGETQVYETTQRGLPGNPHVDLATNNGPESVTRLRLKVLSLNGELNPHIHIRELALTP